MPKCPQCNRDYRQLPRKCTSCQAELDLLVDYVDHLQRGLDDADRLTRAGELGRAVWAYLAVLEVDPDNPAARRQVGQVATAVRVFDRTAPGRRWIGQIRGEGEPGRATAWHWLQASVTVALVVGAFFLGYWFAGLPASGGDGTTADPARAHQPDNTMMGPR